MENKLLNNLNLISISGCGHSGTTLTATVLGAHKNLLLIPTETRMFLDESYDINNFIFNNYSNEKTAVIEKTPNHIYVLDKIKQEYPDAKFMFNIRDPRDIVASLYLRFDNWNKSIDRVKKDFDYIKKFYSFGYLVKYEDIVYNFENTFIDVCKYLEIDFDKNMLEYYKYAPNWYDVKEPKNINAPDKININNKPSNNQIKRSWQVKQPLFDGTGRWKKELSNSQIDDIVKNVGEVANFFGYTI
jgi:protein O-GlcNAc transferase